MLGTAPGARSAWARPGPQASPRDAVEAPAVAAEAPADSAAVPSLSPEVPEVTETAEMPWSEGISMANRRAARELFLEANRLAEGRFFATATGKYRQALALWPHPAFHYNMFVVQLGLNEPAFAYEHLQAATRHGPGPLGQKRYEEAQLYMLLLQQQLAPVAIVCDVPGAEVRLNGRRLFIGPGRHQELLRPGSYYIEASKSGHISDARHVFLQAGRDTRVEMVLRYRASERSVGRWLPWTTVAMGAALAATGGVLHWQSATRFADYDDAFGTLCGGAGCDSQTEETQGLAATRVQAQERRAMATVAYAAGGVALATGVLLLYLNQEREAIREASGSVDARAERTAEHAGPLEVLPVLTPAAVGVSASLRF